MKFLRVFVFVICIFAISKADPAKLIYNTYLTEKNILKMMIIHVVHERTCLQLHLTPAYITGKSLITTSFLVASANYRETEPPLPPPPRQHVLESSVYLLKTAALALFVL